MLAIKNVGNWDVSAELLLWIHFFWAGLGLASTKKPPAPCILTHNVNEKRRVTEYGENQGMVCIFSAAYKWRESGRFIDCKREEKRAMLANKIEPVGSVCTVVVFDPHPHDQAVLPNFAWIPSTGKSIPTKDFETWWLSARCWKVGTRSLRSSTRSRRSSTRS